MYVIIGNPQYNIQIASACDDNLIFDNAFNNKYDILYLTYMLKYNIYYIFRLAK